MVEDRLTISFVKNPLNNSDRVIKRLPNGITLKDCVNAFAYAPIHNDYDIVVTINGCSVKDVDWERIPDEGSKIVFCIVPKDPIDALVALIAEATELSAIEAGVALDTAIAMGTMAGYATMALAYAAMYLVSNLIFRAVAPQQQQGLGDSPTYGWQADQQNYPYEGGALPVLYGTARIVPPRIGYFIETNNGIQYLNMLFLVAGHAVDSIWDNSAANLALPASQQLSGIRINQIPIEEYTEGVNFYTRLGGLDQTAIPFFNDPNSDTLTGTTRSDQPVGVKLAYAADDSAWTYRTTEGNTVEGLGVTLNCRTGLGVVGSGGLASNSINIIAQYRRQGDTDWTNLVSLTPYQFIYGKKTVSASRWSFGYNAVETPNYGDVDLGIQNPYANGTWIEIAEGTTVQSDHKEGDTDDVPDSVSSLTSVPAEFSQWQWHWINCRAPIYDLDGNIIGYGSNDIYSYEVVTVDWSTITEPYLTITGNSTSPVYYSAVTSNRLTPGKYDVRVMRQAAPYNNIAILENCWWELLEEWVYDKFTYPGCSLLAVRIQASDEISGSTPVVDCIANRYTVDVSNPHTGLVEANPAYAHGWASYDILHNPVYGAGEANANFDYDDFAQWAAWTLSKGWKLSLYLDKSIDVATALATISTTGAGATMKLGTKHICIIDQPEQTPVRRFLFTPGNMEADSYSETYLDVTSRANRIELTYYDETNDYIKTPMVVKTPDSDLNPVTLQPVSLDLIGCVSRLQATQIGNMLLKANKYLTMTAGWSASIDSLGCRIGDIIETQVFGSGGRIVSATSATARLDAPVNLTEGESYSIVVKHADDTMEQKYISSLITDPAWALDQNYPVDHIAADINGNVWICVQAHVSSSLVPAGDGRYWKMIGSGVNITGTWSQIPAQFDLYAYGENDQATTLMRILTIEKDQDLKKKITAIEYVEAVYDDDMEASIAVTPPNVDYSALVRNLVAHEAYSTSPGVLSLSIVMVLNWAGQSLKWQVYARPSGVNSKWLFCDETNIPVYIVRGLAAGVKYDFCVTVGSNPAHGVTVTKAFKGVPTTDGYTTQNLGLHPLLNAWLVQQTGYPGNFGTGGFRAWAATKGINVQALLNEYNSLTASLVTLEDADLGANTVLNAYLVAQTGYTGNFGSGQFTAWASSHGVNVQTLIDAFNALLNAGISS